MINPSLLNHDSPWKWPSDGRCIQSFVAPKWCQMASVSRAVRVETNKPWHCISKNPNSRILWFYGQWFSRCRVCVQGFEPQPIPHPYSFREFGGFWTFWSVQFFQPGWKKLLAGNHWHEWIWLCLRMRYYGIAFWQGKHICI